MRLIYDAELLPARPSPPVVAPGSDLFRDVPPEFAIQTEADCDRIWWQIGGQPEFRFVPPNLDQIEQTPRVVRLDPLANTFLSPETEYYFRVKTVRQGVWSEWSEACKFQIEKPAPAVELTASNSANGQVHLQWKGTGEFMVFASNRLDFLPDIYAGEQITSMRGLEVQVKRPNQNRVGEVKENSFEFSPTGRYLRVVARHGAAWSNPSALFTLPDELCEHLPPPVVFQVRWTRVENADPPDVYLGEERPLKP